MNNQSSDKVFVNSQELIEIAKSIESKKDQIMNNRILANLVPMCGFEPLTPYSIE